MSASIKSSQAEVQRDSTPTGTAVIQKADDKQLARRWRNGTLRYCWWKVMQPLGISFLKSEMYLSDDTVIPRHGVSSGGIET